MYLRGALRPWELHPIDALCALPWDEQDKLPKFKCDSNCLRDSLYDGSTDELDYVSIVCQTLSWLMNEMPWIIVI